MDESNLMNNLIHTLESNGEITLTDGLKDLFIQAVDDKEGYAYVSSTNQEFKDSREAISWAVKKMNGLESITEWE